MKEDLWLEGSVVTFLLAHMEPTLHDSTWFDQSCLVVVK